MKKIVLTAFVLAMVVSVATAGVKIDWQISWGLYDSDALDLSGGDNALLDNYSVTWQLIYAGANNMIDIPDPTNVAGGWAGGDDVVWATRLVPQGGGAASDGSVWDNWLIWQGGTLTVFRDYDWNTPGYVYQRIYQVDPLAGTVVPGTWYFDSHLMEYGTGFNADNEHLTPNYLMSGDTSAGIQPDQQVIPEPATMGLLGLGALALALRRRRS